jgi:tol-pal system protein YbgF
MQSQQKSMYLDFDKRLTEKGASAAPAVSVKNKQLAVEPVTAAPDDGNPGLTPSAKSNHQTVVKAVKPDATVKVADKTDNQPNVAEEQEIYQEAYNFIKAKKYNDAVTALQGMLKKYPTGQFAANAHDWLGELYGLMNKHDLALKEFGTVIDKFPDSPRVSDAQLKVGLLYAAQSQWRDAKSAFKTVINHYPGTATARLASEQLKQIKQAGH